MQLQRGHYKTSAGLDAFVSRIKAVGMKFLAYGAVTCPKTGALALTLWDISGRCLGEAVDSRRCDIMFQVK